MANVAEKFGKRDIIGATVLKGENLCDEDLRWLADNFLDDPQAFDLLAIYARANMALRLPAIMRAVNFDFVTRADFDTAEGLRLQIAKSLEDASRIKRDQARLLLKVVKDSTVPKEHAG